MKVARFIEPDSIKIQEEKIPVLNSDELLIEVKSAGIWGTDLHIFHGTK